MPLLPIHDLVTSFWFDVVHAPAVPLPSPSGSTPPVGPLLQTFWNTKKFEILLSVVTLILIGVFLRKISESIATRAGKGLSWISRTFADWTIFRRRLYQNYVAVLDQETNRWQFSRTRPVDMDQFYVMVQITGVPSHLRSPDSQRDQAPERARLGGSTKMEPRAALSQYKRLAVVGEPGMGKTTLLRYLCYLYAQDKAVEENEAPPTSGRRLLDRVRPGPALPAAPASATPVPAKTFLRAEANGKTRRSSRTKYAGWQPGRRVPIYLSLKDLTGVTDLAEHLTTYFAERNFPSAQRFIRSKLEAGHFLFLLDGLDEVDEPEKLPVVIDLVTRFANRYSNKQHPNWIVVSSRPQSYEIAAGTLNFQTVELLDFEPAQIHDFIVNWFMGEPQRADRLWEIVRRDRSLLELGGNPLLLSLIVESFDVRDELDTAQRTELFAQLVNVRFWEWDSVRKVRRNFKFTQPAKERFLKQLALELNSTARSLISQNELTDRVQRFMTEDGKTDAEETDEYFGTKARRFVWEIAEGSGVLYEKAINTYDFSHKTLREYFTALRLVDQADGLSTLLKNLQGEVRDRWEMVALFYAGRASDAAPLIRAIWQADGTLSDRGLLLAARCLHEATSVRDNGRLRTELCDGLFTALPHAADEAREEGIRLLKLITGRGVENYVEPVSYTHRLMTDRLKGTLQVQDAAVRSEAAQLLAQAGADQAAVVPLRADLEAADPEVRVRAARGLARLKKADQTTLTALRRTMSTDGVPAVRIAARNAMLALGHEQELGMVRIPAGEFIMGTSQEKAGYLLKQYGWSASWAVSEMPARTVELKEYFIDRTLVTNAAFAVFTATTGYRTVAEREGSGHVKLGSQPDLVELPGADWAHPRGPGTSWEAIPDHPVVLLCWPDVQAYADWAGKTLPTEPQWERAARGDDGRIWPWGDVWDPERCNSALRHSDISIVREESWSRWWAGYDQVRDGPMTTPVGMFPAGASPFGLLDCAGNVCERTSDWYRAYPGAPDKSEHYGEKYHVLRGGAFHHHPVLLRTGARDFAHPLFRTVHDGFRCVVDLAEFLGQ